MHACKIANSAVGEIATASELSTYSFMKKFKDMIKVNILMCTALVGGNSLIFLTRSCGALENRHCLAVTGL